MKWKYFIFSHSNFGNRVEWLSSTSKTFVLICTLLMQTLYKMSKLWVFCETKWSVLWDWVQIRPWCLCWSGSGLWLWVDGLSVFLFIPTEQLGPVTCELHPSICLSPSRSCLTVISPLLGERPKPDAQRFRHMTPRTRSISQRSAHISPQNQ